MKHSLLVAILSATCLAVTAYLGYARQDDLPAPPTYQLTVADNKGFTQTIEIARRDTFHVITRVGNENYDLSGKNEWVNNGMLITARVKRDTTTLLEGKHESVRTRQFATTLRLVPGGKSGDLGSSSGTENGKPEVYKVTATLTEPVVTPRKL